MINPIKAKKPKKCRNCKEMFEPNNPLQVACSLKCAVKLAKPVVKKESEKKWKEEKKVLREKLKTHGDWENDLQKLVNKIARLIDKGQPCISCGGNGKDQGGHYHSVGSANNLRFNLHNIHRQDYYCNHELSSNIIGYNKGLIEWYGVEYKHYVEDLKRIYPYTKMSIPELKEKISIARSIVKELEMWGEMYGAKTRIEMRDLYNERLGIYVLKKSL